MAIEKTTPLTDPDAAEITVLVVDDDADLADLHTTVLEDHYEVETAYSGKEALEIIDNSINVVLLDRKMPEISGDEVLTEIRERDLDCRVIMVTGVKPDFDIIELGFDGYATKPVDNEELLDRVDQVCTRTRYEKSLQEYYALAEKKAALEATKSDEALETSEEYGRLQDRLVDARSSIEHLLTEFDDERFTTAIERTRSVSALHEREQRYRSLTEDVLDTSRVGTVIVDASGSVVWVNNAIEQYFGLDRSVVLDANYQEIIQRDLAAVFEESDAVADRLVSIHSKNDEVTEFQCRLVDADREASRWVKHWSKPIETGLYAGGRIEHYYDITELKEREQTLGTLHETTRELVNADTADETVRIAVETAESMLGFASVVYYKWDESIGELVPAVSNQSAGITSTESGVSAGDGERVWEAFVEGSAQYSNGLDQGPGSELVIPLGNHGVLLLCDDDPDAFSAADRSFVDVLAANTEVALDRADRERALRERDAELERRNEELNRLNRINGIIRGISRALIGAASRTEIEQAVCDRLIAVDAYEFVWIGEQDAVSDQLKPGGSAGDDQGYLDDVLAAVGSEVSEQYPAYLALESLEVESIGSILEDPVMEPIRGAALDRGYQSVVSVPITYHGSVYGVLEIYAARPHAFDTEERAVLSELGDTIGHAVNAVKRKEALLTNASIEAEFQVSDANDFFVRLAERLDDQVEVESIVPDNNGEMLVFFSVNEASQELVLDAVAGSSVTRDTAIIRENEDEITVKCHVAGSTIVTDFAAHGAIPRSVVANQDGCRVVAEFPETVDLRAFNETLESMYETELLARRERAAPHGAPLNARIDDDLTDRQREALQAAYFAGYFDWPRENPGEMVAASLDISQPTFQQHLRMGERKLLAALFDI